jgi:pre-mRNA-splicing factor 18
MKQSGAYLKPLFDGLRAKNMAADVVEALDRMMRFMIDRDYRAANEVYLTLSIGNEAWPMGVTMVGIHERAARERISQVKKVHAAHVLNDETSRKYIQAVYRLLMFCQRVRPGSASKTFGEFNKAAAAGV